MGCFAKVAANPETDPLIEVICASLNSIGKRADRLGCRKAEADLVPVSGSADPQLSSSQHCAHVAAPSERQTAYSGERDVFRRQGGSFPAFRRFPEMQGSRETSGSVCRVREVCFARSSAANDLAELQSETP